ncbi:MAG TPA: hypothetical protein VJV03_14045 [Pyrinomonadaceae bacterium]|nr:hypothetical protein [Pyrinomonadaceae bacterium]
MDNETTADECVNRDAVWLVVCPSSYAQDGIESDWIGGTTLFNNPVFVHVRFTPNSSGLGGSPISNHERLVIALLVSYGLLGLEFMSSFRL